LNTSPLRHRHAKAHSTPGEHRVAGAAGGGAGGWPWTRIVRWPPGQRGCRQLWRRSARGHVLEAGVESAAAAAGSKATRPLSTFQKQGQAQSGPRARAASGRLFSAGISSSRSAPCRNDAEEAWLLPELKLRLATSKPGRANSGAAAERLIGAPGALQAGQQITGRAPRGAAGRAKSSLQTRDRRLHRIARTQRRACPPDWARRRKATRRGTTSEVHPSSSQQRRIKSVSPANATRCANNKRAAAAC